MTIVSDITVHLNQRDATLQKNTLLEELNPSPRITSLLIYQLSYWDIKGYILQKRKKHPFYFYKLVFKNQGTCTGGNKQLEHE